MINLPEIAKNLAFKATAVQDQCKAQHPKPLNIKAKSLKQKIKALNQLPDDLVLFSMYVKNDESIGIYTLSLYQLNGQIVIVTPDLNILEDFKIVDWQSGIGAKATVEHKSGSQIIINLANDPNYLDHLTANEEEGHQGEGNPPIEYLKEIPQPETPLHSSIIPRNTPLKVIANGKHTRQFNTPMVDLEDTNGEIYKNVIANHDLNRLVLDYGIGVKFEIVKVSQFTKKVDDSKRYQKVEILRIDKSLDLADLSL